MKSIEEIPVVKKIIQNECWYESMLRGCSVREDDPKVQLRVAELILNGEGYRMRNRPQRQYDLP